MSVVKTRKFRSVIIGPAIALLIVLTSTLVFAQGGGGGGEGSSGTRGGSGDSLLSEKKALQEFIELDLWKKTLIFLEGINLDQENLEGFKATLKSWVGEGVRDDILGLKFDLDKPCLVGTDKNMSASTEMCRRGARICMDAYKLATESATPRRVLALLFHELGHTFCLNESDAQALEKDISRYILNQQRAMVPGGLPDWEENDDKSLLTSLRPGSEFKLTQGLYAIGRNMIVIQNGNVYPDRSQLTEGMVFCEFPLNFLRRDDLRKDRKLKLTRHGGLWTIGRGSGYTTMRTLILEKTIELTCKRYPDVGPELTQREFFRTMRGILRYEGGSQVKNVVNTVKSKTVEVLRGMIGSPSDKTGIDLKSLEKKWDADRVRALGK